MPDGRVVQASASWYRTLRLWEPTTGTALGDPLTGHTDRVMVMSVAFGTLSDGRVVLASASWDGMAHLWDPTSGPPLDDFVTHTPGWVGGMSARSWAARETWRCRRAAGSISTLHDMGGAMARQLPAAEPGLAFAFGVVVPTLHGAQVGRRLDDGLPA